MPDRNRSPDDAKMAELVLYIAKKGATDPSFGATKLNKDLFYADFAAYVTLGCSITGHQYRKLGQGPVPRLMPKIQRELEESGAAAVQERDYYGRTQKRLVPLREPNLDRFSAAEISIVDDVICKLEHMNAREVSELSHRFLGWQAAEDGEDIPYSTALVYVSPATEAEEAHAERL